MPRTVRALQEIERWRDRLLAGDKGLEDWVAAYPAADTPDFRALLARARDEYGAHQAGDRIPGAATGKGNIIAGSAIARGDLRAISQDETKAEIARMRRLLDSLL